MSDVTARLDEIERLADDVSPYDHGDLTAPLHLAVPELVAAIRAVLALADELDVTEITSDYSTAIAAELRHALATVLAGRPDPPPGQGSTGATT